MTASADPAHTVLDTDFADGAHFFAVWRQWRTRSAPRALLHYVGVQDGALSGHPPDADASQLRQWALATQGVSGLHGFYRLLLDGGRVSLTLCLGDPQASLRQLALQADAVFLGTGPVQGPALAAIARCCKRGTTVHIAHPIGTAGQPDADALRALGFQACGVAPPASFARSWSSPAAADSPALPPVALWVFNPPWVIQRSRQMLRPPWLQPKSCTVIGAGMSGASVARALALRGWQVHVLDAQDHPAGGASGVPAGLVSPVHSADDGPTAQLTRMGCALMRQHAQALLVQAQDWAPSGAWLRPVSENPARRAGEARHLPEAFWLQPAALVRAWLATPGITFTARARVDKLERLDHQWVCLNKGAEELTRSEVVVIANALDAARLLGTPDPAKPAHSPGTDLQATPAVALVQALGHLHPRYGAVSMGTNQGLTGLPLQPVQGNGNFLPSVPLAPGPMWLAGAGFDSAPGKDPQALHRTNWGRLARLLPDTAADLAPQFASGELQLWQGQRCVSHDRLPLVGAVQAAPDASLWINAAMGARGLTLAALCAELLAARIGGEPLPLPARLCRLLDAQRARQALTR